MADASLLKKSELDKISRLFSLLFNRASMYQFNHPYTTQSIADFHKTIASGLQMHSPLVVIMNREQFFIEEEPFDPRINTARMAAHFKKAAVQSVSFAAGVNAAELTDFMRIFIDLTTHANAEAMKKALQRAGAEHIKINHVFFTKVTEDDTVVTRSELAPGAPAAEGPPGANVLDILAGGLILEELEKALTLRNIIDNPGGTSKMLIDSDLAAARESGRADVRSGAVIVKQLNRLVQEAEEISVGVEGATLGELAEAVFDMKRKLLHGIEAQKAVGVLYEDEEQIRQGADTLTDRVFIRLIRAEYRKGEVTMQRLAQVLRRLVPDPRELQRLLPALRTALLEEGMSPADYLALTNELGRELQTKGVVQALQASAESIGVDAEELIEEVVSRPQMAAELIFLAAEMRRATGDEQVLSDLLVNYLERLGPPLAMEQLAAEGFKGEDHARGVVQRVHQEIFQRLRNRAIGEDLLAGVEARLKERLDDMLGKIKAEWSQRQAATAAGGGAVPVSLLGVLEGAPEGGEDFARIVEEIRYSLRRRGVDEGNVQEFYRELAKGKLAWQKQYEKKDLPRGVLNRTSILYFIDKEVHRAQRYGTPFSALTFAIVRVVPRKKVVKGAIDPKTVNQSVLRRLAWVVREPDMVGQLDKGRFVAVLPMTMADDAQIARKRILGELHKHVYVVNDVPLKVKLAAVATAFHHDDMASMKDFLGRAERELYSLLVRLRNIRELM
jgi:GGDEF domain-containing protein